MNPAIEQFFLGKDLYQQIVMPVCKKYALTYMEYTVLMFLYNNPGYDTAAQIVRARNLTKSHVSMSVKSLMERGLLTGAYFPGNQRIVHLKLTDAAVPVVREGRAAQQHYGQLLVQGFTPEEVQTLQYLMEKLNANIKAEVEKNAG